MLDRSLQLQPNMNEQYEIGIISGLISSLIAPKDGEYFTLPLMGQIT